MHPVLPIAGARLAGARARAAGTGDARARALRALATLAVSLLPASCMTSVGKWTYPSGRYATMTSPQAAQVHVVVEPFLDLRGDHNESAMSWYYVPLMPYGWSHFDRPEATIAGGLTTLYQAEPAEDLARSVVIELHREGIAARAEYAGNYQEVAGATHVLRGRILAFELSETRWSYLISVYSCVLWALGLPMGTSDNGFCVDLELSSVADGRVIWTSRIFDADHHIEGLYYGPEWYRFSWMWERRLREQIGALAVALGAQPAPLPPKLAEELAEGPPARMPEGLRAAGAEDPAR